MINILISFCMGS